MIKIAIWNSRERNRYFSVEITRNVCFLDCKVASSQHCGKFEYEEFFLARL